MRGIEVARPGNTLGDIGHAIQSHAENQRYSVVRDFTGHGLGQVFTLLQRFYIMETQVKA